MSVVQIRCVEVGYRSPSKAGEQFTSERVSIQIFSCPGRSFFHVSGVLGDTECAGYRVSRRDMSALPSTGLSILKFHRDMNVKWRVLSFSTSGGRP